MKKLRKSSVNADKYLPKGLTTRFISAMDSVLAEDPSVKGRIMRENWLSKFCQPNAEESDARQRKAIEKWLSVETHNGRTNNRLTSPFAMSLAFNEMSTMGQVVRFAATVCRQVLGDEPSLSPLYGGFSGGASTSRRRRFGHPARKFLDGAHVTPAAFNLFFAVNRGTRWQDDIDLHGLETTLVRGNILFTVPKTSEIDRVAAKEPDLNLFLQKLFGTQIRQSLRRVGQNLNDQKVNAELARQGSLTGHLMTVDLSSASDSMTVELVRALLPPNWFHYLFAVRSPFTFVNGDWHENQMFSSMGNAATFELESLLFYALSRACARFGGHKGRISVYGDDIIAPSSMYDDLQRILSFCGFKFNESKSFADTPFRESCGAWWYGGEDVKPFYLRRPLVRYSDLILILNQLVNWSSCMGVVDPRYELVFNEFKGFIPSCLHGGRDLTSRTSLVTGDAPRKELLLVTKEERIDHRGLLLLWLLSASDRHGVSEVEVSDVGVSTSFYRLRRNKQWIVDVPVFLARYTCDQEPPIA